MENLNGYNLTSDTKKTTSNCMYWTAEKNNVSYFIKKFDFPKFPRNPINAPEREKEAQLWLDEKNMLRNKLIQIPGEGRGNVICPIEYFREKNSIYVASYWIDRDSLSMKEINLLNEKEKVFLLMVLAGVLQQVHKQNIVHIDLKPDNILVVKNSTSGKYVTKIIDFDESFFEYRPPVEFKTTQDYLSPEVARFINLEEDKRKDESERKKIKCASDIFSLGIIFHEFWTGEKPCFDVDEEYEPLYKAVIKGKKIKLKNNIPVWLKELIISMLSFEPDKRPTINDIHSELSRHKDNSKFERIEKNDNEKLQDDEKRDSLKNREVIIHMGQHLISKVPYDLSEYTKESATIWKKARKEFNLKANFIFDVVELERLYLELEKAYKNLISIIVPDLSKGKDIRIRPKDILPYDFTSVEIISDDKIIAVTREGEKLQVSENFAMKLGLIERR